VLRLLGSWRLIAVLYVFNFMLCAWLYASVEQHPFFNSLWWTTVTWYTIGYGDMYPLTHHGKMIAMYTIVSSHVLIILLTANFVSRVSRARKVYQQWQQNTGERVADEETDVAAIIS
jgi:hypothetical protein